MRKGKIMYFSLLLAVFLVSTAYFSYAFFTSKNEEHGKLNIVAGTLDYKIESDDLENNQITVKANEIKKIDIKLTSLNDISSEYELYYTLDKDNSSVRVGYDIDTKDSVLGTIATNGKKDITIIIRNESDNSTKVTFNVIGGLINNELVLDVGNSLNQVVGKYKAYSIGDEITLTDGSKWHVLENSDENTETVVLLSDYNLNSDGSYNDECGRDINATYICSPMAFDNDNTQQYDETDSNNIGYFIKNVYQPLITTTLPETTNITLPTAEQIAQIDGLTFDQTKVLSLSSVWQVTTHYWTKTANSSSPTRVWYVNGETSYLNNNHSALIEYYGVRPTITTPKTNIVNTMSSTTELAIGTSVEAIDGSKWHVLEASSSDSKYVTLLSDYNLNSDGSYNTSCGRDINSNYVCNTMAFDTGNSKAYDETNANNIGYFIKNKYQPQVTSLLFETTKVTIPTAYQITSVNEVSFDPASTTGGLPLSISWLLTTDYWTKTAHTVYGNDVWVVSGKYSRLNFGDVDYAGGLGARPVITTLKTNLLVQ